MNVQTKANKMKPHQHRHRKINNTCGIINVLPGPVSNAFAKIRDMCKCV